MSNDQFNKQPEEIFPISVDFSRVLAEGETIDEGESSVVAYDAEGEDVSDEIIEGSLNVVDGKIYHKVKGGVSGLVYKITFLAVTSAANVYEKDIMMHVLDN